MFPMNTLTYIKLGWLHRNHASLFRIPILNLFFIIFFLILNHFYFSFFKPLLTLRKCIGLQIAIQFIKIMFAFRAFREVSGYTILFTILRLYTNVHNLLNATSRKRKWKCWCKYLVDVVCCNILTVHTNVLCASSCNEMDSSAWSTLDFYCIFGHKNSLHCNAIGVGKLESMLF